MPSGPSCCGNEAFRAGNQATVLKYKKDFQPGYRDLGKQVFKTTAWEVKW